MTEQDRIETLITALETALDIASEIWDYVDGGIPVSTHKQLELLRKYAKHEREKQGTIEEKESVGDNEQEKEA